MFLFWVNNQHKTFTVQEFSGLGENVQDSAGSINLSLIPDLYGRAASEPKSLFRLRWRSQIDTNQAVLNTFPGPKSSWTWTWWVKVQFDPLITFFVLNTIVSFYSVHFFKILYYNLVVLALFQSFDTLPQFISYNVSTYIKDLLVIKIYNGNGNMVFNPRSSQKWLIWALICSKLLILAHFGKQ